MIDPLFFEYFENKNDVRLRNKLVEKNVNLAYKIAHQVHRQSRHDFEELKQEALLSLIKVVESYNPNIASFSTYAMVRIKGRLYNFLRDKSTLIRIPRKMLEKQRKWVRTKKQLTEKLKRLPTSQEVAELSGISAEDYLRAEKTIQELRGIGELQGHLLTSPLSVFMKIIIGNYSKLNSIQQQILGLFIEEKPVSYICKKMQKPKQEVIETILNAINLVTLTVD
jgi:RNA polymerase sigma factor (sigma-70 family)